MAQIQRQSAAFPRHEQGQTLVQSVFDVSKRKAKLRPLLILGLLAGVALNVMGVLALRKGGGGAAWLLPTAGVALAVLAAAFYGTKSKALDSRGGLFLAVCHDHIEGRTWRVSGEERSVRDVSCRYGAIHSVTTDEGDGAASGAGGIRIRLRGGDELQCPADNAAQVANAIRRRMASR